MAVTESVLTSRVEELIAKLDISLFNKIPSQTTDRDKRSLLACQLAVRMLRPTYTYLEIGSYLGGSLQPFCSMTNAVASTPSITAAGSAESGDHYEYRNNSTEAHARQFESHQRAAVAKITCIDADAREIDERRIEQRPQFCFIAESTQTSGLSDFLFCLQVLDEKGRWFFMMPRWSITVWPHRRVLKQQGISFRAYHLPDTIFLIEINDFPVTARNIQEMLIDNHVGY